RISDDPGWKKLRRRRAGASWRGHRGKARRRPERGRASCGAQMARALQQSRAGEVAIARYQAEFGAHRRAWSRSVIQARHPALAPDLLERQGAVRRPEQDLPPDVDGRSELQRPLRQALPNLVNDLDLDEIITDHDFSKFLHA